MDPTIRPLAPEDRATVVALSLRAWAPVFASVQAALRGSGVFELQYPDGWAAAQEATVGAACDAGRVWVAEVDGPVGRTVAGFTALHLHPAERIGEIHLLAVDPPHQRRGSRRRSPGSRCTGWPWRA